MTEQEGPKRITACFTGHRDIKEPFPEVERRLTETVEKIIKRGYLYFEAGGARGFDALASETVLKLKAIYPQVHLRLILPFAEQYKREKGWSDAEVEQYYKLKERASEVIMLASAYSSGAYYRRNRYLADSSSVCIAYMTRANSGTAYTVNYAKEIGVEIINIVHI